jgi:hypothetical protein
VLRGCDGMGDEGAWFDVTGVNWWVSNQWSLLRMSYQIARTVKARQCSRALIQQDDFNEGLCTSDIDKNNHVLEAAVGVHAESFGLTLSAPKSVFKIMSMNYQRILRRTLSMF